MKQKLGFIGIIQLVCVACSMLLSLAILIPQSALSFISFLRWSIFLYVILMLISNVVLSHKFAQGRLQEILFLASTALLVSNLLAFVLYALIKSNFNFKLLDWFEETGRNYPIRIHSQNPVGRQNMERICRRNDWIIVKG